MKGLWAVALAGLSSTALAANSDTSDRFNFEFRVGWVHPEIDSEPGLTFVSPQSIDGCPAPTVTGGPYQRAFGKGSFPLFELELDYEIVRLFGTLGVGLSAGHFIAIGHGLYAYDAPNEVACLAGQPSGDSTSLRLIPVHALVVWRVDEFWRRWGIPLTPFVKAGYGPTFYWVDNGRGDTSDVDGVRAAGSRWGWEVDVGLAFVVDFLDPIIANDMAQNWGIDHTYLFAELRMNETGMYSSGFNLSDDWVAKTPFGGIGASFGISFEF
jgi:hypothetical protein